MNFIGHNSNAVLSTNKIKNYREGYDEFSRAKGKDVKHAIKIADEIEKEKKCHEGMFIITIIEKKEEYIVKIKIKNPIESEKKTPKAKKRKLSKESDNSKISMKAICEVRYVGIFRNRIYPFQNQIPKFRFL